MPDPRYSPGLLTGSAAEQIERDSATVADLANQWPAAPVGEKIIAAKLTEVNTPSGSDPRQYAFTEQWWNADTYGTRRDRAGGESGTVTKDSAYFPNDDGPLAASLPPNKTAPQVFLRRAQRISPEKGWRWEVIGKIDATALTPLIIAHLELHLVQDFYWSVSGSMAYKPNDSNPANAVAVSLTGDLTGALGVAANGTFAGILFSGQPSGQATAQAIDQIDSARVSVQEVIFFDAKPPQLCWDTVSVYSPFGTPAGWQFSGQVFNNWRGTAAHPASALTITLDGGAPFGGSTTVADPVSGAWGFTFLMSPASYTALRGTHVTATVVNNYGYCDSAQRAMP